MWRLCAWSCVKREKRAENHEARELQHERRNMYTAAMNRVKREQPQGATKLTCQMFLQSDPKLWDYMTAERVDGGLGYVRRNSHLSPASS